MLRALLSIVQFLTLAAGDDQLLQNRTTDYNEILRIIHWATYYSDPGWEIALSSVVYAFRPWTLGLQQAFTSVSLETPGETCAHVNMRFDWWKHPEYVQPHQDPVAAASSLPSVWSELGLPNRYSGLTTLAAFEQLSNFASQSSLQSVSSSMRQILERLQPAMARLSSLHLIHQIMNSSFDNKTVDPRCMQRFSLQELMSQVRHVEELTYVVMIQAFLEDGCGTGACILYDERDRDSLFLLPAHTLRPDVVFEVVRGFNYATKAPQVLLRLLRSRAKRDSDPWRIAEIGVLLGATTEALLEAEPHLHVVAVDPWEFALDGSSPKELEGRNGTAMQVMKRLDRFRPRIAVLPMDSHTAASMIAPGSMDIVFIDGDHRYEAVREDVARWLDAVAKNGILAGHDYSMDFPGVILAVREFAVQHGLQLHLGPASMWWVDFSERQ